MSLTDKMHSGELYQSGDAELVADQQACMELLYDFNHARPSEGEKRQKILAQFLGNLGDNCHIEPPLQANWGRHTHLGNRVYVNFNLTLVDDTHVHIGDDVLIGPNVTITTAGHPVEPELRKSTHQFNMPVHIGDNVWIGSNAVLLPGVSIGENSVIGAGSIVTKDIPANVVAVGNPCRVLREIGEHDRTYYYKNKRIPG